MLFLAVFYHIPDLKMIRSCAKPSRKNQQLSPMRTGTYTQKRVGRWTVVGSLVSLAPRPVLKPMQELTSVSALGVRSGPSRGFYSGDTSIVAPLGYHADTL